MIKKYFFALAIFIAFFINGCGGGGSVTPSTDNDKLTVKSVEIK